MLVPMVSPRPRLLRAVAVAELWLAGVWVVMSVAVVGVLGGDVNLYHFPWYTATQAISIADFLEQIDGLVLAVWVLGMFIRCALLLWATAGAVAQGLGLRSYRALVPPLTAIAVTYAVAQAETFPELLGYLKPEVYTPFTFAFVVLIPLLLLAVAKLRGKRGAAVADSAG